MFQLNQWFVESVSPGNGVKFQHKTQPIGQIRTCNMVKCGDDWSHSSIGIQWMCSLCNSWWIIILVEVGNPFDKYVCRIGSWNPKVRGEKITNCETTSKSFTEQIYHPNPEDELVANKWTYIKHDNQCGPLMLFWNQIPELLNQIYNNWKK